MNNEYLMHFNPFHDPKNGQFASAGGSIGERYRDYSTRKRAKKDAKRYADAKMFYGEGAGNRRKLLKAEINKKKKDKKYSEYFDKYVENADYAKSAEKAKRERRSIDARQNIRSNVHKVERALGTTLIGAAALYYTGNMDKVNRTIMSVGSKAYNGAMRGINIAKTTRFMRRMGI